MAELSGFEIAAKGPPAATCVVVVDKAYDHDYLPDDCAEAARCCPYRTTTAHVRNAAVGQAGPSASCVEAANASGPCSAADGSIHMTCQPWPSRSKKLREYMKP